MSGILEESIETMTDHAFAHLLVGVPAEPHRSTSKIVSTWGQKVADHDIGYRVRMARLDMASPDQAIESLYALMQQPQAWVQLGDISEPASKTLTCQDDSGMSWTAPLRRIGTSSKLCTGQGVSMGLTDVCETRWIPYDMDGIKIPDWNPLDPESGISWCMEQLGHADASCVWQITSKQKLDVDAEARIRIWVLLDKPHHPVDLKNYLKCIPLQLCVDPCIFDGNRIIYITPPLVVHHETWIEPGQKQVEAPDPIPVRSGILWGLEDTVSIEIPDTDKVDVIKRARREAGAGVGGMDIEWLDPGEECSLILDGDLHGGFANATWWLAERNPNLSLDDAIKIVVSYIEQSDLERKAEALSRARSVEFQSLFEGAVKIHANNRSQLVEVPPEHPSKEMPLSEAIDTVRRTVSDFYADGGQVLLDGAAGVGKTEVAIELLPEGNVLEWKGGDTMFGHIEPITMKFPPPPVDFYAPTHALADELASRCQAKGINAVVIRGRMWQPDEDADPICHRHELVSQMRKADISGEGSTLCVNQEGRCPHWRECEYVQQFEHIDMFTQVVVRAHNSIGIPPSFVEAMLLDGRTPHRVVIDESPLDALKSHRIWKPNDLTRYPHPFMKDLVRAVEDGQNLTEVFKDRRTELMELIEEYESLRAEAVPYMPDAEIADSLNKFKRPPLPITVLRRLHMVLNRNEEEFNGIWADEKGRIHTTALDFAERDISNALVLDGTLDDILFRYVMPNARSVSVHVERKAIVHQVWDRSYSHAQLIKEGEAIPEMVTGIKQFIKSLEVQGKTVGLVAPLKIEEAVEHEPSAHFKALRGVDRLKGLDVGVVVGRILPSEFAIEKDARALFPFEKMDFKGEYLRRPAGYRMRKGEKVGALEWYHPDPLINRVLRQAREAESSQGVDRFRLVHRDIPAEIFILCRLPLDVTVDRLIHDPLSVPKLLEAMERSGWVLPLVPDWLVDAMPDLFKNEKAAKDWVRNNITKAGSKVTPVNTGSKVHPVDVPESDEKLRGELSYKNTNSKVHPVTLDDASTASATTDCGLLPGARLLRFRLRDRHKRQADNNLPRLITVLPDNADVIAQLAERFPEDEVMELINE